MPPAVERPTPDPPTGREADAPGLVAVDGADVDDLAADGRHQRRQRNAEAVVDAVVELWADGELEPGAQVIADRSGVSLRSLFRYFEDIDALVATAIERHAHRLDPWFDLLPADGSLDVRLARLVEHRMALHDAVAPLLRASRLRSHRVPRIALQRAERAAQLRAQSAALLEPELSTVASATGRRVLDALELALDLESIDRLVTDRRLGPARTRAVLRLLVDGAVAELR